MHANRFLTIVLCFLLLASPIRGLKDNYPTDQDVSSGNTTGGTKLDSDGGWLPASEDPNPYLDVILSLYTSTLINHA